MLSSQHDNTGLSSQRESELLMDIERLRQEVETLSQENSDLRIALLTTAEHGDLVEAELHNANQQLQVEVTERKRTQTMLQTLLNILYEERSDLEIVVQTLMEHGDSVDMQWCEKLLEASDLARVDSLTQIANRRSFDEYLEQQWKQMARDQLPLSIVLCDVDYFKQFNDTYGHSAGDACLQQIAQVISHSLKRPSDLVARYGGEEFVVILPQTDSKEATAVAELIQSEIQQLQILHSHSCVSHYVTVSIGIASTFPALASAPKNLLDEADRSLYQAKQQGRNQIVAGA